MIADSNGTGVEGRSLDALERALSPVVGTIGLEVLDTEQAGRTLRVVVDGTERLDLDRLAEVAQAVSSFLDEHPDLAPRRSYELEVSSPGLERRLRRADHFARAIGNRVAVLTSPTAPGERRAEGTLKNADANGFSLVLDDGSTRNFSYREVDRAHTVFDWKAELAASKHQANNGGVSR